MRLIFFILIIIFLLGFYFWYNYRTMTFVQSSLDKRYYIVRNLGDKYIAANMLSTLRSKLLELTNYLEANKNNLYIEYKSYIEQLVYKMKFVMILESKEKDSSTSYSVNKGDQLVFCIRSKKDWNSFHNINTLMYVGLHEIAHIACPEYGHTRLFKKIFAFFTKIAIELKLYTYIDYRSHPQEYCGIYITDSII
jgi:hypothetical protein